MPICLVKKLSIFTKLFIRGGKLTKISTLSSGEIVKYEYLTDEEILLFNQSQMINQAKFTYSPLGKAFEKQTKVIEDQ